MAGEKSNQIEEFEPLQAIGIFWIVFGVLILIGIFYSKTGIGKIANSVCGGVLLAVGLFSFFKGLINKKRRLEKLK
jgi:uncharacterized membrane protein